MNDAPRVWSTNEWAPLKEVIIGSSLNACHPMDDISSRFIYDKESIPNDFYSKRVIDETEEDISNLIKVLQQFGVICRRPRPLENNVDFSTPNWKAHGFHTYCPRDVFTVIGNYLIESPNIMRSRYFETFAYKQLFIKYMNSKTKWICAPKPTLDDSLFNNANPNLPIPNTEPLFDAANIIRCNNDILFQISRTGNELGALWLQNILGDEYKVHRLQGIYNGSHLDSTFSLLREGLVLCNPERITKKNMPYFFKSWDKLYCPQLESVKSLNNYGSEWLGMNLLSIDRNTVVVDQNQVELIRLLEGYKFIVIPLSLRHSHKLGGGFHCITVDIRRDNHE